MKTIESNGQVNIYPDDVILKSGMPTGTFRIRCNNITKQLFLSRSDNLNSHDIKVYGEESKNIDRIFNTYEGFSKNLGVILSGPSGMGKSLFIKMLAEHAQSLGMPVIIVDNQYEGIVDILDSIDEDALVIFDEFEKVFSVHNGEYDTHENEQDSLLSLFDGQSEHKKLYVLAVNDINGINEFMLNRPGRFHYHIRFTYPDANAISAYLHDNLDDTHNDGIEDILNLSSKINLSYDCLQALVFELNMGNTVDDALQYLNIINTDEDLPYNISFTLSNGNKYEVRSSLNIISDDNATIFFNRMYAGDHLDSFEIEPKFLMNDGKGGCIYDFHKPVPVSIQSDDNGKYNHGEGNDLPELYVQSLSMHRALNDSYRIASRRTV